MQLSKLHLIYIDKSTLDFIIQLILLFVLIGINAFFVAAEMALVRIRRTRIEELIEQKNKTAVLVLKELNNPDRYILACQLGITIVTLTIGAAGERIFADDLSKFIDFLGIFHGYSLGVAKLVVFFLAFSVTAFLQTIFGELLPKILTFSWAEPVVLVSIWPMRLWCSLIAPFLNIIDSFKTLVLKVLRIPEPPKHSLVHSGEELKLLVSESQEKGVLEEKEEEMLHSVFDFSDTVANEVMTPRTDMICLSAEATIQEFIDLALLHGYSRIPVYEEDIDSIFGYVHIRDGLRALVEHKQHTTLRELAREVLIVPENKPAADLLTDFKKTKTHMAIIVDEYGGVLGLVTIEDLIEELVGDIADEHEVVEEYFSQEADGSFLLDAKLSLEDASERLGIIFQDEEFNTLGGHVFGLLGREPKAGDEVQGESYILRVEEADKHRILKLRLIIPNETTPIDNVDEQNNGINKTKNSGVRPVETSK